MSEVDLEKVKTLLDKTECACAEQRLCSWHYLYRTETLAAAIQLADEVKRLREKEALSRSAICKQIDVNQELRTTITRLTEALERIKQIAERYGNAGISRSRPRNPTSPEESERE